jgi:hypothetical protein
MKSEMLCFETVSEFDNAFREPCLAHTHPRVMDSEECLAYERDLDKTTRDLPAFPEELGRECGIRVQGNPWKRRPKQNWLAIVAVTAGLMMENMAFAAPAVGSPVEPVQKGCLSARGDGAVPFERSNPVESDSADVCQPRAHTSSKDVTDKKQHPTSLMKHILHSHYAPQPGDPSSIRDDLNALASYYSNFPELVELFKSLDREPWRMQYRKGVWQAVAKGNVLGVTSAVVNLDLRVATQLRFNRRCKNNPACTASPGDVLIHEMLHVRTMLLDTTTYLKQRGMSLLVYASPHEYDVISQEKRLYAAMTKKDGMPRPQRHSHRGKLVAASCPVCIK